TQRMIEGLPFTYLHVFTFSRRPGTPAAQNKDQVPVELARKRNQVLKEIAAGKKAAFMRTEVGTSLPAITLRADEYDHTEALTDNYLKVRIPGHAIPNR